MQVYGATLYLEGNTPHDCALKIPKAAQGVGLRLEAMAMSRAHRAAPGGLHPNIAEVTALLAAHERPHGPDGPITVRRVHGLAMPRYARDLLQHLTTQIVTLKARIRILRQVTDALGCAHDAGVAHGDIKDANILLKDDLENVVISDFGSAHIAGVTTPTPRGTLLYSPPEAFAYRRMDEPPLGTYDCFPADVWSLGVLAMFVFLPVTMYSFLVKGRAAIRADTDAERVPLALLAIVSDFKARARDQRSPLFSPALAAVLDCALEDDPCRRATMQEVAGLLAVAAEEEQAARVHEAVSHLVQSGELPADLGPETPTQRDLEWWIADQDLAEETLQKLEPLPQVRCVQLHTLP